MYKKLKHFTCVFTIFFFISLIGTYTAPTQFSNHNLGGNKEAKAIAPVVLAVPVIVEGVAFSVAATYLTVKACEEVGNDLSKVDWKKVHQDCKDLANKIQKNNEFMKNVFIDEVNQKIYLNQAAIQVLKKVYQDATAPVGSIGFGIPPDWHLNCSPSYPFVFGGVYDSSGLHVLYFFNVSDIDWSKSFVTPTSASIVLRNGARGQEATSWNNEFLSCNYFNCDGVVAFGAKDCPMSIPKSVCVDPIAEGIKSLPTSGSVCIPLPKSKDLINNPPIDVPKDVFTPKPVADKDIPSGAISLADYETLSKIDTCSPTEEAQENIKPTTDSLKVDRYINGRPVIINQALQDAHIKGTKVYEADIAKGITRSLLTEDAEFLLDYYAGTGYKINDYTELADFEDTIGQYYDTITKTFEDTSMGVIIYGVNGAHIVPAKPDSKKHKKVYPGTIEQKGTVTDYTNKAGNKMRIHGKVRSTIKDSIEAKLKKTNNKGAVAEGETGKYVNSKKEVTSFDDKVENLTTKQNGGDIDVATEDELIEVKNSIGSLKEEQISKYINDEDPNFFNYARKKVIVYIKEKIIMDADNIAKIERLKSKGVEVVNSLDELGRLLR